MSYVNRKFGHCAISWTIAVCCKSPYHVDFSFESPVFHVETAHALTRWRMTLRHRKRQNRSSKMKFELKRLALEGAPGTRVDGQFKLTLPKGEIEEIIAEGFFQLEPMDTRRCDIKIIDPLPSSVIDLKLKLIFKFDNVSESFPECSDPYVKDLSEIMREMFGNKNNGHDIMFRVGPYSVFYMHKCILLQRIKREEAKKEIREEIDIYVGTSEKRDAWFQTCAFLYTANMKFCTDVPSLDTYKQAENYGLEPLITYYQPDYQQLYTRTECEDLVLTWVISDLNGRRDLELSSPRITGELGSSMLKMTKTERGDVTIECEVDFVKEKYICLELHLKTETSDEIRLLKDHARVHIRDSAPVPAYILEGIPKGGSVTLKLVVRMHCTENDLEERTRLRYPSLGESRTSRKPYCDQRNYKQLSDDMISVYRGSKYFSAVIGAPIPTYRFSDDEDFLLSYRCPRFAGAILSDAAVQRRTFEPDVLRAVVQFIYSGRLGDGVDVDNSFKLREIAKERMFSSLVDALFDHLKKLVNNENVNRVYALAEVHHDVDVQLHIKSRADLTNLVITPQ